MRNFVLTGKPSSKDQKGNGKRVNPFDLKYSKTKFDVLNKKNVVVGKPLASRSRSNLVREKTLLSQIKSRGKISRIIDKRIDKSVPSRSSSYEDLINSSSNAKKKKKQSLYDLVGQSDDELNLTHQGKSINSFNEEDFADELPGDEQDYDEDIVRMMTTSTKSKAEVMKEVMAKSKFYKAERQRIKEENEELRESLDAEFSRGVLGGLEAQDGR